MNKDLLYPLRKLHGMIVEGPQWLKTRRKLQKQFSREQALHENIVFLLMTPEYNNLGDHALAVAEKQMLQKLGIPYIEVTTSQLVFMKDQHCLSLFNGYPIIFSGGGYLGTLWFSAEEIYRLVIQKNPRSAILFLPNSVYYEDSAWGREQLEITRGIFKKHKNLRIYARENTSFQYLKQYFSDVRLAPDMVLSMKLPKTEEERKGCILCLRSDCERTRPAELDRSLQEEAAVLFHGNVRSLDMETARNIPISGREEALNAQFTAFSKAELVITDRLHGMIFCALTGTPCIVVDSKSPKVRGCYQWIRDLPYIRFLDGKSLKSVWEQMPPKREAYDPKILEENFRELEEDLRALL